MMFAYSAASYAYINPKLKQMIDENRDDIVSSREDCQPAEMQTDLDINNVRARLLVGGDLWWNKAGDGRYVVPKPAPGFPEVSALFAGGVWIGGYDQNGNLKLAAATFSTGNDIDWYAGPLTEDGTTELETCNEWDKFFEVLGSEVKNHVSKVLESEGEYNCDSIVDGVKYWPAKGNPFFAEKYGFQLPRQELAPFFDISGDGIYNPCEGDFPIVDIRGCEPVDMEGRADINKALKLLPDQMIFWIYNDNGGPHRSSFASPIQMEVQVQAFSYATNDEINDMTFYRYKLINKATDPIGSCYFAMFVDPDLGCYEDDYIGCDTTKVPKRDKVTGEINYVSRDLMYVYNEDRVDGTGGSCDCSQGVNTYCETVPVVGVDYFRGPRRPYRYVRDAEGNIQYDENGKSIIKALEITDPDIENSKDTLVELGMTSFTYFNNPGTGNPDDRTTDPDRRGDFYNYMIGRWKDGTPFTVGGSGFNPESTDTTSFALPAFPNTDGWNMCTADLPSGDRRTIQATGPLLLTPGANNELIVGAVFVPDIAHPCPDLTRFIAADEIAQNLFDNCFELIDGPDAPDMYSVELDRQLILMISNDTVLLNSNNAYEQYEEVDINAPVDVTDNKYRFEGYQIYQLVNPNVSTQELEDIEKARLIRQVDVKNGVTEIYNWESEPNPLPEFQGNVLWVPTRKVDGQNEGIEHSFNITQDAFAEGDTRLVNHKNYYYTVLAYAYNNYAPFDVDAPESTQKKPFLQGRENIRTYTFTPRPLVFDDLNAVYGEEPVVTRIEGIGTGKNFIDMDESMYDIILSRNESGEVVYRKGYAPIDVKITDPLRIQDGVYRIEIVGDYDDDSEDPHILDGAKWKLTDIATGEVIISDKTITEINEQLIYGKGFSVSLNQVDEPGTGAAENNGYIGEVLEYENPNENLWLTFIDPVSGISVSDGNPATDDPTLFPYAKATDDSDPDGDFISQCDLMIPIRYTRWEVVNGSQHNFSPGWQEFQRLAERKGLLPSNINNVDIVLTSDKSKWSRCPVVETANNNYKNLGDLESIGSKGQFDLRDSPSVDKNGQPDGTGNGMGWFPGYAVDVETGERLNIFFGENSVYRDDLDNQYSPEVGTANNGDDMIWNPSSNVFPGGMDIGNIARGDIWSYYGGGQHYIYVTRQQYDEGASIAEGLRENLVKKDDAVSMITWAGWPMLNTDQQLLSVEEGLIPNKVTIKLRATNAYNKELDPEEPLEPEDFVTNGGLPTYNFAFTGKEKMVKVTEKTNDILSEVSVVPNPYFAYSNYENSQFSKTVRVTNLPDDAIVTIYSLDGKFIRQFRRSAVGGNNGGNNPVFRSNQTIPYIEWDLNNSKGIPIASGAYIFHIESPSLNAETSVKWFGVNRKFDPTGL